MQDFKPVFSSDNNIKSGCKQDMQDSRLFWKHAWPVTGIPFVQVQIFGLEAPIFESDS